MALVFKASHVITPSLRRRFLFCVSFLKLRPFPHYEPLAHPSAYKCSPSPPHPHTPPPINDHFPIMYTQPILAIFMYFVMQTKYRHGPVLCCALFFFLKNLIQI